jgi:3-oxoacyl-[acyl-carrier protein] reductase
MRERRGAVVVTGAARGIGKAVAEAFAGVGEQVVLADINEQGEDVAKELSDRGLEATFVRADMTVLADITALMDTAVSKYSQIRVLVNNAGVTRPIDFFEITEADWNSIMELNARGYFFAMQAAARHMRESGGGSIVNVASIAGKGWRETSNVAYASSKGAVVTMTRIAAGLLGSCGVRVNSVCPGMTRTELMENWITGRAAQEGRPASELLAEVSRNVSLGRLSTPGNIADAVLFLASDAASTITGQSLNVDGGVIWD